MGWKEGSEAGVLSGKPWEDHTAGLTSHSVNANTRKIGPGWCQIRGSRLFQEEKRYPFASLEATRSPEIVLCCKAMSPQFLPQEQACTWAPKVSHRQHRAKQRTRRPIALSLGQQPQTEPRVTRAQGGKFSNSPSCPTSVPHRSSCSGLGTLWQSPRLGSRMIFLYLWTNILSSLPSQRAGSREHCAML